MTSFVISTFVIALVSFLFGVFIYVKNRQAAINRMWAFVCFAIFIWQTGLFFELVSKNETQALFWNKFLYIGAILIPVLYYHFVLIILDIAKSKRNNLFLAYFFALFFLSFNVFTKLFVSGVPPAFDFKFWVKPGILYYPYVLYVLIYFILSFFYLYGNLKKTYGIKKQQIKYFLLSGVFGLSGGITVFFPQLFGIYPFGNYFVILYIIIVVYAIAKHRLMDIRFVLRRYSVYLASLISIIIPAIIVKRLLNISFGLDEAWLDYLVLIVAITFFPTLRDYYFRVANKYFFTSLYDAQKVIADLSDKLSSTLDPNKIYKFISDSMVNSLHARSVQVYIFIEKTKKYESSYYYGSEALDRNNFTEDQGFYSNYLQSNTPIIIDELKQQYYVRYRNTIDHLKSKKIEIIAPLRLKDRTIGIIALGHKESHDVYNDEDIALLEIIGAQSAIAIDNAINYEEVKSFSQKLQHEVEIATEDLIKANAKLKQLDQAKSEFVSIASHQLRTPLTVIKGYISMFLDGSFGALEGVQKDSMEKVYHSNERLIQLVENLLNISRIESGRLRINKEPVNLGEMVANVIEELNGPAKKKGLKFNLSIPKNDVLVVPLDQEKIRQVILNLIDNSIKYTTKGVIKIKLSKRAADVLFCVEDKGMGIRPGDLVDLFDKFSRGTGTALVHTEGTGLGLYVAKQMVEVHNGKIWAESKGEGKGSKFCFTLPLIDKNIK